MSSRAVGFLASAVRMPDGEHAIMLALPAAQTGSRSPAEIASRAIGGFTEAGHFIAFIDAAGGVEAASDGFAALGIQPETLAALVGDVANGDERIVKRMVPGGASSYPAGLARLTDTRHLLVVIDEDQLDDEGAVGEPYAASAEDNKAGRAEAGQDNEPTTTAPTAAAADVAPDAGSVTRPTDGQPAASATQSPDDGDRQTTGGAPAQHDHWYFNAGGDEARQPNRSGTPVQVDAPAESRQQELARAASAAESPAVATIDRSAPPLRFVWRTDAEGRFSALSAEFAGIVGKPAADVIGRRFKDVAATFGLDASGEIAGLLERRDTWSGRSVLWPVAGTDLKIPVDLAALPVYGRSRAFEGFRGFGVARSGDAVVDPEAIGMALVPNGETHGSSEPAVQAPETETAEPADPFKGEVPALTIVPKPERRFADKVIRLAEHRQPANDKGLSTLERSAFREIGERLKKDSATPVEQPAETRSEEAKPAADRNAPVEAVEATLPGQSGVAQQPELSAEVGEEAKVAATVSQPPESETEAAKQLDSDAEDEKDLARLDGVQPEEDSEEGPTDQTAAPAVSGSLLDYADHTDEPGQVADSSDAPVSEPDQATVAPEATKAEDTEPAVAEAPAMGAGEDDSMTSDDFRDAEDSEDWAPADEASSAKDAASLAGDSLPDAAVPPPEQPLLKVPPLKLGGFLPSAFSTGDETKDPDTSILGKLPVPLLIHSGDALYYANDEFLHLTGYDALDDLADAGGIGALFADPYADDGAADESDRALRLRARDGQEFPIDAILRSVPWRGGKALMLVVRRSGEDEAPPAVLHGLSDEPTQPGVSELKSRIAEMRTIIDTATDGVVLIGRDGAIRSISRPAEALFGFDSDEVAGKPFASLFAIESQRAARDYLNGLSEPGVASVMNDGREVIGREAQGRFIPLFMTIGRLPSDSGFCAVVRDITQWKRAEEDLTQARAVAERASSQKTDFLARISHEIRTPLNAIIGFSELMVDEKFGPVANDRYRDYLRDINRSGNHVLDLVNDLLDISKIEAGQQEMDYEAVSLNDTLAETVAMMQPQANRERVIIRSSFASRLPEVVADLRSVRQIALNILSNAIRYTQAGGQVIVSTAYETSGDVVMRVRDTGIGMSQAEIEQALKPFKQINALKRGRGDGTGLGLPLTKAMVEANRARFSINSTPGEGTLVEVAFPSTRVLAE